MIYIKQIILEFWFHENHLSTTDRIILERVESYTNNKQFRLVLVCLGRSGLRESTQGQLIRLCFLFPSFFSDLLQREVMSKLYTSHRKFDRIISNSNFNSIMRLRMPVKQA